MIKLYQMDHCPYCIRVRSFLKKHAIEWEGIDSPKGSEGREELLRLGGKGQVRFMVDDTRDVQMYESADIIHYLTEHYT